MSTFGRVAMVVLMTMLGLAGGRATAADETVTALPVEIIHVKPESDGYTLKIRDDNGAVYQAVISLPNLGPNSGFDFDHLKVGNRMIISGTAFNLGNLRSITIREARAN